MFAADKSRAGHPWIKEPRILSGGDYVLAAHMLSETLATRVCLARGRGRNADEVVRTCRRCRETDETQMHVLNGCPATRRAQIDRHNWVCDTLRHQLMKSGSETEKVSVLPEIRVKVGGEEYKPDLTVIRGPTATVVDVAIAYDSRAENISRRYHDKLRKYDIIRGPLKDKLNQRPGQTPVTQVEAMVVGSRGLLLPESCQRPLSRLGLQPALAYTLQEGTLRGLARVWRCFTAR